MNLEEIKKDVDITIREMQIGTSLYIVGDSKANLRTLEDLQAKAEKLRDSTQTLLKDAKAELFPLMFMIVDGKADDQTYRTFYKYILILRNTGYLINNPDALSSMKMEKFHIEQENVRLATECERRGEELEAYKKFVALQGKTFTMVK